MQLELRTPRVLLRRWRPEDREPLARINADPRVMEFFPAPPSREESAQQIERFGHHFDLSNISAHGTLPRPAKAPAGLTGLHWPL